MSPRPYRLGKRQAATDHTRTAILEATRALLATPEGLNGFSLDAVAKQAGVARMTIYYQFESKVGLLEALFDDLADRGQLMRLAHVFREPDPVTALTGFIEVFCHFWASDPLVLRRLQALSVLDPELDQALTARGNRRREGVSTLLERLSAARGRPTTDDLPEITDQVLMLTSFEAFDALATADHGHAAASISIRRLVWAALGLADS